MVRNVTKVEQLLNFKGQQSRTRNPQKNYFISLYQKYNSSSFITWVPLPSANLRKQGDRRGGGGTVRDECDGDLWRQEIQTTDTQRDRDALCHQRSQSECDNFIVAIRPVAYRRDLRSHL